VLSSTHHILITPIVSHPNCTLPTTDQTNKHSIFLIIPPYPKMKLTSVFVASAAFLASLVSANPIHVEKELVARQHSATSADVTGFSVTRNATHVL
jgi:hypothetical protein